jgi:hypothetical protein
MKSNNILPSDDVMIQAAAEQKRRMEQALVEENDEEPDTPGQVEGVEPVEG